MWGLFRCGESGESQGSCGDGGELQHLTAGVGGFGHRGNLRPIVWIPNFWEKEAKVKAKAKAGPPPAAKDDN